MALANVSSKGNPGRNLGKGGTAKLRQLGGESKGLGKGGSSSLLPRRQDTGPGRNLGKA